MKILTSTTECVPNFDNNEVYLAWKDMKLDKFGDRLIDSTEAIENVCKNIDPLYRIQFPGNI